MVFVAYAEELDVMYVNVSATGERVESSLPKRNLDTDWGDSTLFENIKKL